MNTASFYSGGDLAASQILTFLDEMIPVSESIDLAVSFVRLSGVRLLLPLLKQADQRGVPIRLICGSYLQITEPAALRMLRAELSERVEMRLYTDPSRSFHPKCWIFHESDLDHVLIGSSNVSRSALTSGIEWNYHFSSLQDRTGVRSIQMQFDQLWGQGKLLNREAIEDYRRSWSRPALPAASFDEEDLPKPDEKNLNPIPNAVQTEALYALQESRDLGYDKALIQAATGTGKTYLAAFDSKTARRILFVAHRQEILDQAGRTFQSLRPDLSVSRVGQGSVDLTGDLVLASVATLGKEGLLTPDRIAPDAFDYVIIDEFHHAAADSYLRILNYFQPEFLLGLTATPYRLDGRDLYALCDYNVPYRIELFEAVRQGFLVPFHYYGICDDTDYSSVRFVRGRLHPEDLSRIYVDNTDRARTILRHFQKYHSRAALGFCVSKEHARFMAEYFQKAGIACASVVSDPKPEAYPFDLPRDEAIEKLKAGELRILFSVDLFNEGVDIPCVDMVLFLRPTESAVIYLQQLGRGLRHASGKEWLTVLDFIGNYRSADLGPSLLLGSSLQPALQSGIRPGLLPAGCLMDFDLKLIDLFEDPHSLFNRSKVRSSPFRTISGWFDEVMDTLGRVPTRLELFSALDEEQISYCFRHTRDNPFRQYLSFLQKKGLLDLKRKSWLDSPAGRFVHMLETTSMSKVYKMPLLMSFLSQDENGEMDLLQDVDEQQALKAWKSFFSRAGHWVDLKCESLQQFETIPDRVHLRNIRSNPVHFLLKSEAEFFVQRPGSLLGLADSLLPWLKNADLAADIQDVLSFRAARYYAGRYTLGVEAEEEKKR